MTWSLGVSTEVLSKEAKHTVCACLTSLFKHAWNHTFDDTVLSCAPEEKNCRFKLSVLCYEIKLWLFLCSCKSEVERLNSQSNACIGVISHLIGIFLVNLVNCRMKTLLLDLFRNFKCIYSISTVLSVGYFYNVL